MASFDKENKNKFPAVNFFQFYVIKPWIRIREPESGSTIRKMLDPDPYPDPH
jgi:hypothetical protein